MSQSRIVQYAYDYTTQTYRPVGITSSGQFTYSATQVGGGSDHQTILPATGNTAFKGTTFTGANSGNSGWMNTYGARSINIGMTISAIDVAATVTMTLTQSFNGADPDNTGTGGTILTKALTSAVDAGPFWYFTITPYMSAGVAGQRAIQPVPPAMKISWSVAAAHTITGYHWIGISM